MTTIFIALPRFRVGLAVTQRWQSDEREMAFAAAKIIWLKTASLFRLNEQWGLMDRLDAMRLLTRVVDRRSFTQAARDLGVPRSTATQVIKHLEERLGVGLLQRTTRTVRPTVDGEEFYRRCLAILDDVEDA